MIVEEIEILCAIAWRRASDVERVALSEAANLQSYVGPADIFRAIARAAPRLPMTLTCLLWDELEPDPGITRMELGEVRLSDAVSQALQLCLAYELGTRIDRALARIGGVENEAVSQEELEAVAAAER